MLTPLVLAYIQPVGDRIAMPPAGHYQDDSVNSLDFASQNRSGQQAARRSKSTAKSWQVEGVAPRHLPPLPSLFYLCVVRVKCTRYASPLTKLVPVSVLKNTAHRKTCWGAPQRSEEWTACRGSGMSTRRTLGYVCTDLIDIEKELSVNRWLYWLKRGVSPAMRLMSLTSYETQVDLLHL